MARRRAGAVRATADNKKPMRGAGSSWPEAKSERFLEVLAETCNVTRAATEAGVSSSAAYRRRASDASFRAAWGQALSIGYAQLEMMMLERALHGVEKIVVLKSGESRVMREYCDRTAIALLKMHRDSVTAVEEQVDTNEYQEACERILARLKRLRERDEAAVQTTGAVETKGAFDRIALIGWARTLAAAQGARA